MDIYELLSITITRNASDLHLVVGHPPILRISRRIVPLVRQKVLNGEDTRGLAFALMDASQQERLLVRKEIDFSYNLDKSNYQLVLIVNFHISIFIIYFTLFNFNTFHYILLNFYHILPLNYSLRCALKN